MSPVSGPAPSQVTFAGSESGAEGETSNTRVELAEAEPAGEVPADEVPADEVPAGVEPTGAEPAGEAPARRST